MKKIKTLYKNILWLMNNNIKNTNQWQATISGEKLKKIVTRSPRIRSIDDFMPLGGEDKN
jgi:hypothetical protein